MAEEKPKDWVDFGMANSVPFGRVVAALGLDIKRTSDTQWQGVCPLHVQKGEGRRESFGFSEAKGAFNCFACKKSGDLIRFVSYVKGIGAKDAAMWLVSLVDNSEVQEHGQEAAGDAGVQVEAIEAKAATSAALTKREAWLVAVVAQGVAWYLAETFRPLSDVETIKKCIVAKVEMAAAMEKDAGVPQEQGMLVP
jgi:hypothetical protein